MAPARTNHNEPWSHVPRLDALTYRRRAVLAEPWPLPPTKMPPLWWGEMVKKKLCSNPPEAVPNRSAQKGFLTGTLRLASSSTGKIA